MEANWQRQFGKRVLRNPTRILPNIAMKRALNRGGAPHLPMVGSELQLSLASVPHTVEILFEAASRILSARNYPNWGRAYLRIIGILETLMSRAVKSVFTATILTINVKQFKLLNWK